MARSDGGAASSIIMSFVLGTLTGAAVALLIAPATGDEIRRKLAEKAREGAEKASEAARQGREFVEQQRGSVAEAIERGREAYHQAKTAGVTPLQPTTTPTTPSTPSTSIKPGGAAL